MTSANRSTRLLQPSLARLPHALFACLLTIAPGGAARSALSSTGTRGRSSPSTDNSWSASRTSPSRSPTTCWPCRWELAIATSRRCHSTSRRRFGPPCCPATRAPRPLARRSYASMTGSGSARRQPSDATNSSAGSPPCSSTSPPSRTRASRSRKPTSRPGPRWGLLASSCLSSGATRMAGASGSTAGCRSRPGSCRPPPRVRISRKRGRSRT